MSSPDRLAKVLRICEEALAHEGAERTSYLDTACGADAALRSDVEALLQVPATGDGFLDTPPWATPALAVGQRLGPYEITGRLGAGGMGQVYEARDSRLGRTVAIKVLPPDLAADPVRRLRLEQEARAVSGLNHPHICVLHDVGEHDGAMFLVMEHLSGQTLAVRLQKGPLPLDHALAIATQVAEGLAAAHRHGVIHRDLKPGNVMLTKSGAKLLDFGLAKLRKAGAPLAASVTMSVPAQEPATSAGTVLGTVPYMAPEQLEGKDADARSDIFSFGALLYEMLTGKRAFEGGSHASLIAAILEHEPAPLSSVLPLTPLALDRLVSKCLHKDPDRRWQTASDVADELRWLSSESGIAAIVGATPSRRGRRSTLLAAGLGLLVLAAIGIAGGRILWRNAGERAASPSVRASILLAASGLTLEGGVALSPDGQTLVFVASRPNEPSKLWMRRLTDDEPVPLKETDGASLPFFSFDGQEVAYLGDRGALYRLPLNGGTPQLICDAVEFQGGAWGRDGTIVYAGGYAKPGLWAVSEQGGTPRRIDETSNGDAAGWYSFPDLLPDGKTVLFSNVNGINVWSPATGTKRLMDGGRCRYLATGHLVYEAGEVLREVDFDARRFEPIGRARTVVQKTRSGVSSPMWAVSEDVLVYAPPYTGIGRLVWKERDGKATALPLTERAYLQPSISRQDDHRLVVSVAGAKGGAALMTGSTDREPLQPLVPGQFGSMPSFTWDGRWVLYTGADAHGRFNIFRAPADGSGKPQQLTQGSDSKGVATASPDGRVLLLHMMGRDGKGMHLWEKPLESPESALQPLVMNASINAEGYGRFSPEGRQVAYVSDGQVWVREYPTGRAQQISSDGGTWPVWNARGNEVFYQGKTGMMSVTFVNGRPQPAVRLFPLNPGAILGCYDVSPDGMRFLMVERAQSEAKPAQLHLVLNWQEDPEGQRVPNR